MALVGLAPVLDGEEHDALVAAASLLADVVLRPEQDNIRLVLNCKFAFTL